jgi:transposase
MTFKWYLGVDWGSEKHAWCLIDATGTVHDERMVAHEVGALAEALRVVRTHIGAEASDVAVALEISHGVLVDTLLDYGLAVFAINPKQLDRFRDRFTVGGAKDDHRDARTLADALRTDARAFRAIHGDDPRLLSLRELSRMLEELQIEHARLVNRLREQLYRIDAPWLRLSPAANDPWLWALLRDVPHPDAWAQLSRRRVATALRVHHIRRVTVDEVMATLRQPHLRAAAGVTEAVAVRLASLLPQLLLVHQQFRATEQHIDRMLADLTVAADEGQPNEHRDASILQSLPGVGRVVAATMLTEACGPLAARDYPTLRALVGVAPVTKRSGKRAWLVHMRYACKRRLREAVYHWARTSIQHDAIARAYYQQLRLRGHNHARALRSVGDRWLRILIAMLQTRTLYDATKLTAPFSMA